MALIKNIPAGINIQSDSVRQNLTCSTTVGSGTDTWSFTVPDGTTYFAITAIEKVSSTYDDAVAINNIAAPIINGTNVTIKVNTRRISSASGTKPYTVSYIYA